MFEDRYRGFVSVSSMLLCFVNRDFSYKEIAGVGAGRGEAF